MAWYKWRLMNGYQSDIDWYTLVNDDDFDEKNWRNRDSPWYLFQCIVLIGSSATKCFTWWESLMHHHWLFLSLSHVCHDSHSVFAAADLFVLTAFEVKFSPGFQILWVAESASTYLPTGTRIFPRCSLPQPSDESSAFISLLLHPLFPFLFAAIALLGEPFVWKELLTF